MPNTIISKSQGIPYPHPSVAGLNTLGETRGKTIRDLARAWAPKNTSLERPACTIARYAVRLIDRNTGRAYSADELFNTVSTAGIIIVAPSHDNATDVRGSHSAYEGATPFATIQAAIDAAASGDTIILMVAEITENLTVTDKALTFSSGVGGTSIVGTITTGHSLFGTKELVLDAITLTSDLIQTGAEGRTTLINDSKLLSGFSQTFLAHHIDCRGCQILGDSTVVGKLSLSFHSILNGDFDGTGEIELYGGTYYTGSLTATTVTFEAGGQTYHAEVQTPTISETVPGAGVAVQGLVVRNGSAVFPGPYADDAAAATGGVAVNEAYLVTGGTIAWRQA